LEVLAGSGSDLVTGRLDCIGIGASDCGKDDCVDSEADVLGCSVELDVVRASLSAEEEVAFMLSETFSVSMPPTCALECTEDSAESAGCRVFWSPSPNTFNNHVDISSGLLLFNALEYSPNCPPELRSPMQTIAGASWIGTNAVRYPASTDPWTMRKVTAFLDKGPAIYFHHVKPIIKKS
jgi:hypothetical protein